MSAIGRGRRSEQLLPRSTLAILLGVGSAVARQQVGVGRAVVAFGAHEREAVRERTRRPSQLPRLGHMRRRTHRHARKPSLGNLLARVHVHSAALRRRQFDAHRHAARNHEGTVSIRDLGSNAPRRQLSARLKRLSVEVHPVHDGVVGRRTARDAQTTEHIRGRAVARQRPVQRRAVRNRERVAGRLPGPIRHVTNERDGTRLVGQLQQERAAHRRTRHVDDALQARRLCKIRRQRYLLPLPRIGAIAQHAVAAVRLLGEIGRARQAVDVAVEAHKLPRAPAGKLLGNGQVRLVVVGRVHARVQVGAVAGQLAARFYAHDRLAAREACRLLHRQTYLVVAEVFAAHHGGFRVAQTHRRRTLGHEVALHLHSVIRIGHRRDGRAGILRAVHRGVAARGAQALVAFVALSRAFHQRCQLLGRLRLVAFDFGQPLPGQHRRRAGHRGGRHRRALLVGVRYEVAAQADAVHVHGARLHAADRPNAAGHVERQDAAHDAQTEVLPVRVLGEFGVETTPRIAADTEAPLDLHGNVRLLARGGFHEHDELGEEPGTGAFCTHARVADAHVARLLGNVGKIDRPEHDPGGPVSRALDSKRVGTIKTLALVRHGGRIVERKVETRGILFDALDGMALGIEALVQHGVFVFLAEVVRAIGHTRRVRFAGGPRGQDTRAGGHHVGGRLAVLGERGALARGIERVHHDGVGVVGQRGGRAGRRVVVESGVA